MTHFSIPSADEIARLDAEARAKDERDKLTRLERSLRSAGFSLTDDDIDMIVAGCHAQTDAMRHTAAWYKDAVVNGPTTLILSGPCGTGKTFAAARAVYKAGLVASFVSAASLSRAPDVCDHGFVVLDDLGNEATEDWRTKNAIFRLIDKRQRRLTVITTNLVPQALTRRYDGRIIDRLRGCARLRVVTGESMRKGGDGWED